LNIEVIVGLGGPLGGRTVVDTNGRAIPLRKRSRLLR